MLVVLLTVASFVIPIAQAHEATAVSLKKHLAYGAWFAVIAAGYGCQQLIKRLSIRRGAALACCVVAFAYPAINGWWAAWHWYNSWQNASSVITATRTVAANTSGNVYALSGSNGLAYIFRYYLPDGNWQRYIDNVPSSSTLNQSNAGVIVLVYVTSIPSPNGLPAGIVLGESSQVARYQMLRFIAENMDDPQLAALTLTLEKSHSYQLVASGPYNSDQSTAVYTVWKRKAVR
jgi:hypothetical protein